MIEITPRFLGLMHHLGVADALAQPLLDELIAHYDEPHRCYHNLSHISALLRHFDTVKTLLNEPLAVELAIFYHDIIYDPTRSDNEAKSAELMCQQLPGCVDNKILTTANDLIMMTQTHQVTPNLATTTLNDAYYFLDMDLAILGSERAVYQHYAKAIRQEYAHVPEADYQQGRAQVLQKFLQRPQLFFSEPFYQRFERLARVNISWERQQLTS